MTNREAWEFDIDPEFGLVIAAPWFCLSPPLLVLFLPWLWLELEIRCDGGFWVVLTNPRRVGSFGPRIVAQGGAVGRFRASWRWEGMG